MKKVIKDSQGEQPAPEPWRGENRDEMLRMTLYGKTPKAASSWTQHYLTGLGIGLGVLAAAGGICLFARRRRRG